MGTPGFSIGYWILYRVLDSDIQYSISECRIWNAVYGMPYDCTLTIMTWDATPVAVERPSKGGNSGWGDNRL